MSATGSRLLALRGWAAGAGLVALVGLATSPAWPIGDGGPRLVFDPEATEVTFELGAALHTVNGSADLERGELVLDLADRTVRGEVVVDAESARTGKPKRDRHMHRQVLLSAEHPRIVLRPRSWQGELDLEQDGTVTVRGMLELVGEEHEVELPVAVRPEGEDLVTVDFELEIPYVEWGLEDPSTFLLRVEKTVTVAVRARASLTRAPSLQ